MDNVPQQASCRGEYACSNAPGCDPTFPNPCIDTGLVMSIVNDRKCEEDHTHGYCEKETREGDCMCWMRQNECTQNQTAVCATFDSNNTCLLGSKGFSDPKISYTQNVNWGINTNNNPYDGWATCHYEWNFDKYTSNGNEPNKFSSWLNDIYNNI